MTVRPTPSGQTPGSGVTRTGKASSTGTPARPGASPAPASSAARQDDVSISSQARELQQRDATGGGPSGELSPARLHEVLGRISSGYYDQPQVQAAVVRRISQEL